MNRLSWLAVLAIVAGMTRPSPAAQIQAIGPPAMPEGSGTIAGTILLPTGQPAAGATAALTWVGDPMPDFDLAHYAERTVVADRNGRFKLTAVTNGAVELSASLDGYLKAIYGQARAGFPGTPIRLSPRENLSVNLRLTRGATLAGAVTGPDRRPAAGIHVYAFRLQPISDTEFLLGPDTGHAVSDVRGDYRIENLAPGRYAVSGYRVWGGFERAPIEKTAEGYSAVESGAFSGGADNFDDAEKIDLDAGTERVGVDLHLAMTAVTTISGAVTDQAGRPVRGAQIWWQKPMNDSPMRETTTAQDGGFQLTRVTSGDHEVIACAPSGTTGFGRLTVTSDGRTPISRTIGLEAGASVTGRVRFTSTAGPIDVSTPVSLFFARAHLSAHGDTPCVKRTAALPEFRYDGVPPGRYVVEINRESLSDGWVKQTEIAGGRDAFDFPFEVVANETRDVTIVLTRSATSLSGVVTDDRGRPSTGHTVVVFAAEERYWTPRSRRILTARPDQHGRYRFIRLPAGDYIVALGPPDLYGLPPSTLLRDLRARGTRLTLGEGASLTQDVRARPPRF